MVDSKVAKAHERNFYEIPIEIKVSLMKGVSKRLYPLVLSRSDLIRRAYHEYTEIYTKIHAGGGKM